MSRELIQFIFSRPTNHQIKLKWPNLVEVDEQYMDKRSTFHIYANTGVNESIEVDFYLIIFL
mgnify:CR=1 FL=1